MNDSESYKIHAGHEIKVDGRRRLKTLISRGGTLIAPIETLLDNRGRGEEKTGPFRMESYVGVDPGAL
jgi:hypothetical protein